MNRSKFVAATMLLPALLLTTIAQSADADDDKVFYFLGTAISDNLQMLNLSAAEAQQVIAGFSDALNGKAEALDRQVYGQKMQQMTQQRMAQTAERELQAGQKFVDAAVVTKGAVQTDSGLVYREVRAGSGKQPIATSTVRAHYKGTLRDGTVFDSSYGRGEPLQIGLSQVIPCWTEGISMMKEGGKAVLTCPAAIAYGPRGQGAIPPNAALQFEVELIEVVQ